MSSLGYQAEVTFSKQKAPGVREAKVAGLCQEQELVSQTSVCTILSNGDTELKKSLFSRRLELEED